MMWCNAQVTWWTMRKDLLCSTTRRCWMFCRYERKHLFLVSHVFHLYHPCHTLYLPKHHHSCVVIYVLLLQLPADLPRSFLGDPWLRGRSGRSGSAARAGRHVPRNSFHPERGGEGAAQVEKGREEWRNMIDMSFCDDGMCAAMFGVVWRCGAGFSWYLFWILHRPCHSG